MRLVTHAYGFCPILLATRNQQSSSSASPAAMVLLPHGLAQQVLQGPGAWEHQPGFLYQQLCQYLAPQQLQQVALWQYQSKKKKILL